MSNRFDPIVAQIKSNLETAIGEVYNFLNNNRKKSAGIARKCFLAIRKACTDARNELQEMKSALPVRRRVISEETKLRMKEAREAKKASKTANKVTVEKA